ncbi:YdeI/OmpD-associated family protein [Spirosoma aerolatum]|uniref:YdeI/OmpD-associated family protein n=1 Tax=Spirosoma aerolatum TaxID=1211326 RepID=UPI0009AE15E1|nr:YdeI/OmpD-associated family protein [Spirosoma aerolatum]
MIPTFFATQDEFREWLANNHDKQKELLVGFHKVSSGKPSMTWSESVDQALCFGWIDGVRKSYDENSYTIRFTPRKSNSIWSAVNIQKVEELTRQGFMQPAGLAAYEKRQEHKSKVYAYEQAEVNLSAEFEQAFRAQEKAWDFFEKQAPWYRKVMINWVMSAKQPATRQSRLDKLIAYSAEGKRV